MSAGLCIFRITGAVCLAMVVVLTITACAWIEASPEISDSAQTDLAIDNPQPPPNCPVTTPNGRTPTGEKPFAHHHGNAALVTALWPNGVVLIDPGMVLPDGTLGMKWPWWREVSGRLIIEGRRLDDDASSLDSDVSDGYGDAGFQPSGLLFPSEGCWEITGRLGDESLTFVTWVQRR